MQADEGIYIMRGFPDFTVPGFDMEVYNDRFKKSNVIIHASSADISYAEHWGCLSIKCAVNGNEYYRCQDRFYAVNSSNYLILNEGSNYSSYIFSRQPVESFTINFSSAFEATVIQSLLADVNKTLDSGNNCTLQRVEFTEKLYAHDNCVSPVLNKLYRLSLEEKTGGAYIAELYYVLLERLLLLQQNVNKEIKNVAAAKASTQKEIYKRLHYAQDYIDSSFSSDINLQQLSVVACLNSAYFLRQFKKYFGVTPYRYIIQKRLAAA
ncbi:MAG TPA: AraC family transcriptional regulator, partial [Chitinophagaceae bacterium]|nr:AraC family transcriptional regulator [Chitinophagaceae bacterium]